MKPIKLTIQPSFLDGYIYLGILFLISHNGEVCSIPMTKVIKKLEYIYPQYAGFLRLAFLRNDWLNNSQSKSIFNNANFYQELIKTWNEITTLELNLLLSEEDITKHHEVPSMPIFDFKSYGMKLFMGHRDGLHEFHINSNDDIFKSLKKPEKIFDARTSFLSAKSGELMVSSNSDGLFRGSFQRIGEKVKVNNKVLSPKSIRTGWSSYDVLNYSDQTTFDYFENKTKKPERNEERAKRYSSDDETSDKTKIEEFGIRNYSVEELISKNYPSRNSRLNEEDPFLTKNLNLEDIDFSFNSNSFCFFALNNGSIKTAHISKDKKNENIKFRRTLTDLPVNIYSENFGNIISSSIVPRGCVIELFEAVMIVQNEKHYVIETEPCLSVKTFPSSKRFRNIVLVFKDEDFSIHSSFPIDLAENYEMQIIETMDLPS